MRKLLKTYSVLLLLLAVGQSAAVFSQQQVNYSYQYYNTTHGLPSPEIICLAKDNRGFLWIGTVAGLSMYDGYKFQNYAYSKDNELIGHVNVIKTGAGNRLWIGSGAGLFCFDNNEIVKISAISKLPQGVNDVLPGNDGYTWLATENGPVKLALTEIDFTGKKKLELAAHILTQWRLQVPVVNQSAALIRTATDSAVFIAQNNSIYRLYRDSLEQVVALENNQNRNKIDALFAVSKSKIYFDAVETEISKIENGVVTTYPFKDFYKPGVTGGLPGSWYIGIRGAFYFHPGSGIASALIQFQDMYLLFPTAVLEDNGFLWVASHDGLTKLKPSLFTGYNFTQPQLANDYYSCLQLRNGQFLLGGNRGKIFEKKGALFSLLKDKLVPDAEVKALYEDERGWLWAASGYQGLALIRNGKAERFTSANGLHDNSLFHFIKTSKGKLYVTGDQGISEIIVHADKTISFKRFFYPPNISKNAKFCEGVEAPDGSLWLGCEEGVICFKNDSLRKFDLNGKQFYINSIIKDKQNTIWIATSGEGILQCVFNKKNELEIIKPYTENEGLATRHYMALLADSADNIWAGSSAGISLIGRQGKFKNRVLNFDESDGFLKAGYSYIRLKEGSDGDIWAVTSFGFLSFKPAQLFPSINPPQVYITAVRMIKSNQPMKVNRYSQQTTIDTFGYSKNSFNFSFTALDYANQENTRYYYKLEGLDTGWNNSGGLRSIGFENLSPGKYTFRVKAFNNKNSWSKEDAVYTFIITPPFWKTWWFLLLLGVSIASLAMWVARKRIYFIKKREAEKTELQKLKAAGYREQLEIEKIINHFATAMTSVNSIDDILWDVSKSCISELDFEDCVIYLKDEERNMLVQKAAWGPKTNQENNILHPIEIPVGKGIVGSVAATGRAEIIADTSEDDRYIIDDQNRLSEITVPIINNGSVLGVIDSEHSQKNFYTKRHLQILVTIASLCAGKIDIIKAEQQTRDKEMEVLRLNKDVATSQLTALRMQMNPHFIFNALNSVQHFILQGNVVEANKYLSKFSKLQREILHCSSMQFITLEKELEILGSYLQLEQFRFGESFNYSIDMTEEIEPVEINIPPMMLQPFVENAIWHGLMPLQKDRKLSIFFDLYTDDILLATIRDNGIGREAAARLKNSNGVSKPEYASKGMSMVQQRLKLLQQQYDKPFDATISDIVDASGLVNGTQVTLKIFIGSKKL